MKNIPKKERIRDLYLCLRVSLGNNDRIAKMKCNPNDKN
jgi:hypothetical protein